MSRLREHGRRAALFASALALSLPLPAQDDEPSLDFLAYLGNWEEGDEAWYVEVQIEATGDAAAQAHDSSPKESRVERDDD